MFDMIFVFISCIDIFVLLVKVGSNY